MIFGCFQILEKALDLNRDSLLLFVSCLRKPTRKESFHSPEDLDLASPVSQIGLFIEFLPMAISFHQNISIAHVTFEATLHGAGLTSIAKTTNNTLHPRRLRKTRWIIIAINAFQNVVFASQMVLYMSIRFPNFCLHERNGTFLQYPSDRRWTLSVYVDVPLATAQQGAAEELRRCSCT